MFHTSQSSIWGIPYNFKRSWHKLALNFLEIICDVVIPKWWRYLKTKNGLNRMEIQVSEQIPRLNLLQVVYQPRNKPESWNGRSIPALDVRECLQILTNQYIVLSISLLSFGSFYLTGNLCVWFKLSNIWASSWSVYFLITLSSLESCSDVPSLTSGTVDVYFLNFPSQSPKGLPVSLIEKHLIYSK